MSETAIRSPQAPVGLGTRLKSLFLEKAGAALLGHPRSGAVTVTLPSGRTRTIGNPTMGEHAHLVLHNFQVLGEAMRRGTIGFASAYMKGHVEVDDLTKLFRFFLQNKDLMIKANPGVFRRAAQDLAYHLSRRNTREGARENISEHYDLGNDFYAEWLDPTMTYSSAYFTAEDETLEEAQRAKYRRIAEMTGIGKGTSVLEIGCGWGGFAEVATGELGARVHGITLSREQLRYAQERLRRQGLDALGTLVFEDYRDTMGSFDHIVSIEMIEAVGEEHWPTYFQALHDRLVPGGTAAIQAITIRESDFEDYRSAPDFIQRYIFPGGMLLTKTAMREEGEKAGLRLEAADTFRIAYARTLRLWREAFLDRWPVIAKLGYSEEFRRKWVYYLCYCEAGFAEGAIDVGIYLYRRPPAG